jgi:hypothetical protein
MEKAGSIGPVADRSKTKESATLELMPQIHPDVLRSGDAAAIQAAEALIKALTVPKPTIEPPRPCPFHPRFSYRSSP